MISKINKGEKFVCVRDVVMDGEYNNIAYTAGKVYQSEFNNCLTNDQGNAHHFWTEGTGGFFIPYTYAAVSAHYDTCKTMDEADPFAMLLLDLEPTLERSEACSCGQHNPNGIYNGTTPVREGLTRSEFLELEKVLFPELENQIKEGFVTREQLVKLDEKINWRDEQVIVETWCKTLRSETSKEDADSNKLLEDCYRSVSSPLPPYYDNTHGSLYKIAEQRGWNFYQADAVKRIDRALKKGNFRQDIEKTIALLQLWVKEIGE